MRYGRETDYQAPFMDVINVNQEREEIRVAAIDRDTLLQWRERVKADTYPATYGHSGFEFTFSRATDLL